MEATMFQDSLIESGGRFKTRQGPWGKALTIALKMVAFIVLWLLLRSLAGAVATSNQVLGGFILIVGSIVLLLVVIFMDLPWKVGLSFLMQAFLIGIMILIPLIYTEALPKQQLMTFLVAPPPPPPPPPPAAPVQAVKVVQTDIENGQLRTPTKIPQKVAMIKEEEAPPQMSNMGGVVGGVPGGVPGGSMGGVLGGILSSTATAPRLATPQRIRVSQGVAQGNLITQVSPPYPPMAKMARVQGDVVLQAVISKQGTIENLRVVSGHPMLVQSALDAVKQWRYRPYLLNGEPVEVEFLVTVKFSLAGS